MVSKDKANSDDLKVGSTLKAQLFGPPFRSRCRASTTTRTWPAT